jgi:predicted exporter
VFDKYAGRFYDYTARNRRPVLFILISLIIVGLAFLFSVEYESSMDEILPQNEVVSRSMAFFRDSNIAGKVAISLGLKSGKGDINDLIREADLLAGSLDRNLFTEVTAVISEAGFGKGVDAMLNDLPEMVSGEELSRTDAWITRGYVSEKLHDAYLQLLKPQGLFLNCMLRSDPLGIRMFVLNKLKVLSASTGYDVDIKNGHLVSRDGRHVLLIARAAVPVTDAVGSRKLLESLNRSLRGLPDYMSADVICGHTHSVSNEKLIKRDITFISIFVSVLLVALYVFVIRDFSAVLIFLIPVAAILLAVDLSYLFLGKLSYWVIGLGSTVAGITIDYGTHVYFAARGRSGSAPFVKHVIKPVSFGAFTTIAIFIAFFFSGIKGYTQLAVLTIITVILSTLISLFVLPHLLAKTDSRSSFTERFAEKAERSDLSNGLWVLSWIFLTLLLAFFSFYVNIEKDIKKIDGTEKEIILAEERFREIWGGEKTPAVLVVNAKDYEGALEINERIYKDAVRAIGAENISSMAVLWPSAKMRRENSVRWSRFWTPERIQKLRGLLTEEGKNYNFSENAFDPFFTSLKAADEKNPPSPPFNKGRKISYDHLNSGEVSPPLKKGEAGGFADGAGISLFERFVQKTDDGYRLVSFFPDTEENVDSMNRVSAQYPGTYLVSAAVLSDTISEVVSADLRQMTWIAAISMIALTYLCFFNLRETLIALVPPLTGVIWLFGIMAILGLSINAANMIAGVLAIGLTSDYGIFMTYRSRGEVKGGTVLAITLCTVTTLIGAGVLIFAMHPALSSVGTTMVIGVGSGFLSSVLVVPKLCELTVNVKKGKVL